MSSVDCCGHSRVKEEEEEEDEDLDSGGVVLLSGLPYQHVARRRRRCSRRKLMDCGTSAGRCGLFSRGCKRRFSGFVERPLLLDAGQEIRPAEAPVTRQLVVEEGGRLQAGQHLF